MDILSLISKNTRLCILPCNKNHSDLTLVIYRLNGIWLYELFCSCLIYRKKVTLLIAFGVTESYIVKFNFDDIYYLYQKRIITHKNYSKIYQKCQNIKSEYCNTVKEFFITDVVSLLNEY